MTGSAKDEGLVPADLRAMCAYCCASLAHEIAPHRRPLPAPTTLLDQFPSKSSYPLFVTWEKVNDRGGGKRLRGCIGTFTATNLETGLRDFALRSALNDSRFEPMQARELDALVCGVSLLTNFEAGTDYLDWTVGVHGIWIEFVNEQGRTTTATYLPQIAPEQGWSKMEAMDSLLRKGGIRGDITEALRKSIKLTRYQSTKASLSFKEYTEIY